MTFVTNSTIRPWPVSFQAIILSSAEILKRKEINVSILVSFVEERYYSALIFEEEKRRMILSCFDLASVAGSQYPET